MSPTKSDPLGREPNASALHTYLQYLRRQQYASGIVFVSEAVPQLLAHLGYPLDSVFFQPMLHKTTNAYQPDAIVAQSRSDPPYLIVEAKLTPYRPILRDWQGPLESLRVWSGAYAGIIFTPDTLAVSTADGQQVFDLRDISETQTSTLFELLRAPAQLRKSIPKPEPPSDEAKTPSNIEAIRLQLASLDPTSNAEKGKALESLTQTLFETIAGLRVAEGRLRTSSSEIDLVVEILQPTSNPVLGEFGRYLIVECRNWKDPVRAKDIRDFVGKIVKTQTRLGVLVSRNGITGEADSSAALREVQVAFDSKGIYVVVVADDDLRAVGEGVDFLQLLDQKLFALRFDL